MEQKARLKTGKDTHKYMGRLKKKKPLSKIHTHTHTQYSIMCVCIYFVYLDVDLSWVPSKTLYKG